LLWAAAVIAGKNVAVTAWLAFATRQDAPRLLRTYLQHVLAPFALMLCASIGGRWGAEYFVGASIGLGSLLLVWTASGVVAALSGAAYLIWCFPGLLRSLRPTAPRTG
jgi:hypothetical protein